MTDAPMTREELLAAAERLVPKLRERAVEAEEIRRVPDATVRDLIDTGLIRATLPSRLGGSEVDYRTIMEIVAILAHGCASTAWVTCNFLSCTFKLALWPEEAQDEVWSETRDARLTGTLVFPAGRATRADGGWRLSGRWPFGSGIDHAGWNFFAATEEDGTLSMFLVPKSDYAIDDTWRAAGLRGTGSHHVVVDDIFVPNHRRLRAEDTRNGTAPGNAVNPGTVYRLPLFSMFFTWVGAAVLGTAEGAVESYVAATKSRLANYSGQRVADYGTVQVNLAEALNSVDTARRLYLQNCDEATAIVEAGGLPTLEDRARYRAQGAFAATLCCRAVDLVFTASGGGGLYDGNPISRAFRDVHAGRAHITQNWEPNATTYGRVALGLEIDNPLL